MVDSTITRTIVLIILFSNIKEVQARGPQLNTFHVVIWQGKSIVQLYKAVLCHYKIFQSLHNFPPRTFPPENPATRVDTMENINLISHQETSSKDKPFRSCQSSPKQQASANLKVASCQIPPPGQVRLPPTAHSTPVQTKNIKAGFQLLPQPARHKSNAQ